MPRTCTICSHAARAEIDKALVAGEALRGISRKFFGSVKAEDALARHKAEHVPATLAQAQEAALFAEADSLLDRLRVLNNETADVLRLAKNASNHDLRLKAIGRLEKQLELEGKLIGELQDSAVTVIINARWVELRALVLQALKPFPEAAVAVASALEAHDAGQ
jgi:hypothetical protein